MLTKLISFDLGSGVTVSVEVLCYPSTPEDDLQIIALAKLKKVIEGRFRSLPLKD